MDHTCRRRETVEECGEQPRKPRRNCATQERSQGEKGRNGSKGKQWEQKVTPCTSSSTFLLQPPQRPQQPQQLQLQCVCSDDLMRLSPAEGARWGSGEIPFPCDQCGNPCRESQSGLLFLVQPYRLLSFGEGSSQVQVLLLLDETPLSTGLKIAGDATMKHWTHHYW